MKEIKAIALTLMTCLMLSGCSVGMAMKGKRDPDLRVIRAGAHRAEIELQVGYPVSSQKIGENTLDIYHYEVGNEPSAGRAMGHAAMDILTLGLWEVAGTPIEAVSGDKRAIAVTYDSNDIAVRVGNAPVQGQKKPEKNETTTDAKTE